MRNNRRVVVVTGGGSGMGRVIARRFAQNGDTVYILGRRLNKLQETAKGFPSIKAIQADVTDVDSLEAARDSIVSKNRNIDVLVNNAGGSMSVKGELSLNEAQQAWNQILVTNLSSVFYVIATFKDNLVSGGRVITITSLAALGGSRQGGVTGQAYSAAKAGLHCLSRTLVSDFAKNNITINCVAPGVIDDTEFFQGKSVPVELREAYLPRIPLGRLGKPEEVAAGVFYLASKEAAFISGEILNINGGAQFGR
jgi:3-oxoacyl-[acyl-carrier protein] reductase